MILFKLDNHEYYKMDKNILGNLTKIRTKNKVLEFKFSRMVQNLLDFGKILKQMGMVD